MADPRHTRRVFLGRAGSLALASSLAGCGIEGTLERAAQGGDADPGRSATRRSPIGDWTFSNWPLYIDKKVLKTFDKQFGGHVKYVEDINDNDEFYGKVRQQLQADQPIGRDIVVLTDPMAGKWVRNRYVAAARQEEHAERRQEPRRQPKDRFRTTRSASSPCRGSRAPSASATTRRRPGAS